MLSLRRRRPDDPCRRCGAFIHAGDRIGADVGLCAKCREWEIVAGDYTVGVALNFSPLGLGDRLVVRVEPGRSLPWGTPAVAWVFPWPGKRGEPFIEAAKKKWD